jgi:glutathione synthase/RimK-type ligase-like ATP-grasp enzyme
MAAYFRCMLRSQTTGKFTTSRRIWRIARTEIQTRLGLDYAGIDFGLNAAGDILLFEANATMVVNPPEADEKWAYRRPAVERVPAAVRQMLLNKAAIAT